jgi:hypothetical protein
MIDFFAVWNLAAKEFVDRSMNVFKAPTAAGVSILVEISQPEPATGIWLDINIVSLAHR